ncbi:MAG: hypothetical protein ACTHOK_18065 [Nocardioidaceae bacterium]
MTTAGWQAAPTVPGRAPAVVLAAAIVTWVAASMTAALVAFGTAILLVLAGAVFEAFDGHAGGHPAWTFAAAAGAVVLLSATADVLAFLTIRRHRWACWALIGLSVAVGLAAASFAYYVVPLAVTVAAIAVVVLLLRPESRRWVRPARAVPER